MERKERRANQDRRQDKKRMKSHDPYSHLPERRHTPCRRIGKERVVN